MKNLTNNLLIICIVLQVLDGVLTAIGLHILPEGIDAEGNPFLRRVIIELGIVTGLFIVKFLAVCILLRLRSVFLHKPPKLSLICLFLIVIIAYFYAVGGWVYTFLTRSADFL